MDAKEFLSRYLVKRKDTRSLKWDALQERYDDPDLLAMWVADTEFKVVEEAQDALRERVDHGAFGYTVTPDSYYEAFIDFQKRHHDIRVEKDWVRFTPGVVAAIYWSVHAFTEIGDAILIQSPVYYPFHDAAIHNDRKLVESHLINKDGKYEIDFEDFEQKIIDNDVKMFILCNPHNPAGRVWKEEELSKLLEICERYNVLVISDEIHQDYILYDNKFVSALSVDEESYHKNLIVMTAPSKTFNLACLLNSNIVIPDEKMREKWDKEMLSYNQVERSLMGQIAAEACYNYSDDWIKGLLSTIEYNYEYLKDEFERIAPEAVISPLEGTYLMWVDLSPYIDEDDLKEFIQDKCRLAINFGKIYSDQTKGHVRFNLATDPKYLEQAIENIEQELKKI